MVTVAAEIGATADELAARLADDVVVDDVTGLRVVPTQRARVYLAALRAAQQAQADRRAAALAEARRRPNPTRERVKALQARESTGDPFADVLRDHLEGRLDHAAAGQARAAPQRAHRRTAIPPDPKPGVTMQSIQLCGPQLPAPN